MNVMEAHLSSAVDRKGLEKGRGKGVENDEFDFFKRQCNAKYKIINMSS
jgi:hypothetical protein